MPQNRKKAIHVCNGTSRITPLNDSPRRKHYAKQRIDRGTANPGLNSGNQPQATMARNIAGMFAPLVPNAARLNTGNETPYFVPACALRIMG